MNIVVTLRTMDTWPAYYKANRESNYT